MLFFAPEALINKLKQDGFTQEKMERRQNKLDIHFKGEVMTPDEVAKFFKKSTSWVYKNWKILGGAKLGGSLFFPNKEELFTNYYFKKRKRGRYDIILREIMYRETWVKTKI